MTDRAAPPAAAPAAAPLAELLAEATRRLRAAGVGEARREAARIWADASGGSLGDASLRGDRLVPPPVAEAFGAAVARRLDGAPLAYATGWAGFRNLVIRADRRALIPRPETEGLVELLLGRVRTGRAVDVGTGSGCLALSLAAEGEFAEVVAIDLSGDALALAAENRALAPRAVAARVRLVRGDLCAALRPDSADALVANPPYLSDAEHAALDPAVGAWEPALALRGGPDGLAVITRLLAQGRHVLRPGGWLALEVDSRRAAECARRARALGWDAVSIHHDLFGRERFLLGRRSETP